MVRRLGLELKHLSASKSHAEAAALILKKCLPPFWPAKDIRNMLNMNNVFGFFSENVAQGSNLTPNHRLRGFDQNQLEFSSLVMYSCASDELEILKLCVLPNNQRAGLAKNLMHKVFDYANVYGINKVFLEVAENNVSARKFYVAQGFSEYNRRNNYYINHNKAVDAIMYSKVLRSTN